MFFIGPVPDIPVESSGDGVIDILARAAKMTDELETDMLKLQRRQLYGG